MCPAAILIPSLLLLYTQVIGLPSGYPFHHRTVSLSHPSRCGYPITRCTHRYCVLKYTTIHVIILYYDTLLAYLHLTTTYTTILWCTSYNTTTFLYIYSIRILLYNRCPSKHHRRCLPCNLSKTR